MIEPTVGRVVWFTKAHQDGSLIQDVRQPLAAFIVYVHNNRMINVGGFDANGVSFGRTSVLLLQDDDPKPEDGYFACWMPYQKGQAAKAEALEAELKK